MFQGGFDLGKRYNLFNLGRHQVSAKIYRLLRLRAFATWEIVVA